MDVTALSTALTSAVVAASLAALTVQMRHLWSRGRQLGYFVFWLGGSFVVLAVLAIVMCAVLVAAGLTFVSGTEVVEAAVYLLVFTGIVAGAHAVLGRSHTGSTQQVITTDERLAAARAAALLASEKQQQRLEGALQLEALSHVRPDLIAPAAQAFTGLVSRSSVESSSYSRYEVLAAMQALSRLNPFLREHGQTLDLRLADLARLDLSGLDLRGANLTGADLTESTLVGTDLAGTDLSEAQLDGADLSQADLTYAYMRGASIERARLTGVHVKGTYPPATDEAPL